ncbi:YgiT-type zinc finger protein [Thioalkalivibrio paradoxus]|uniref:YgiT-type zinc finger protein n=1 Tax=Thioalkalivibrio paradoxus TaxID=108010 RepID=UPI0038CDBCB5
MYCQGEMARGHAPFYIDRKDVHVSFDNVPAWVCPQCGGAYFEETAVDVSRTSLGPWMSNQPSWNARHEVYAVAVTLDRVRPGI